MNPENQDSQKSNAALRPSDGKSAVVGREEAVLAFWKKNDIFKKSLEKDAPNGEFIFFEGPPTANAKPALHHLEARAFKDVVPRYKTMQGYHVRRRAGWDTHGLPVELQIEKKLGFTHKKQIEAYGIAAFNKACKESVFEFIKDWEVFTDRIGYWVDQEHAYYTFDTNYIESLWNILGTVEEKKLLYKDYKVVPWCARCGTALASHELAQGYQDDKDLSVVAKFKVKNPERIRYPSDMKLYLLAWTTTPWTLPGNVALAVGENIEYQTIQSTTDSEFYLLAKERNSLDIYKAKEGLVITDGNFKGSDLVGLEYEPLYPYLGELIKGHHQEKNMESAYKVHAADFVTTTDGTGIVHIAPMYGADDFDVATKNNLPKFHTVNEEGRFIAGTDFLEGRFVKDEDVAVDTIKNLAYRGLLFKKEKYEHSYPHCWRCKTPLIYYARDSWYIRMSELRDKLVSSNEEINWEPAHIKEGRFGEWLREVKDWAISRERYWGTPLPIWQPKDHLDTDRIVVDSIDTLKKYSKKSGNSYFVMRHAEAEHNVLGKINCNPDTPSNLTKKGIESVRHSVETIRDLPITKIFCSQYERTKDTAKIVQEILGNNVDMTIDERIGEFNVGSFNDKEQIEYHNAFPDKLSRFTTPTPNGETLNAVRERMGEFIYELESKYRNETMLIISHGDPLWMLDAVVNGYSPEEALQAGLKNYMQLGEIREINFAPLPHNENYELDLHRPYIDDIVLEKDGKEFHRVKEVLDVWFDSGSMPFAQDHYPFDSAQGKPLLYPADFISEAIDQTRGWFYTLHAVGNLMNKGKAYKNVICLGHLLDREGKKMSKSIGNIVEPFEQIEKFGADTIRLWMYSVNAPGESKNYDEKTVGELQRQVFGLLYNVLAFYELYRDQNLESRSPSNENVLDAWIAARLDQLITLTTDELDNYRLMNPVREIRSFIEDLSTWYVRRSRDRIKDGDKDAKMTLYRILKTLALVLAPFAPFAAEDIWQKLKSKDDAESVHLSEWPKGKKINKNILDEMNQVREVVSLGLEARQRAGIKVRQPLAKIFVKQYSFMVSDFEDQYLKIIKDELNIKGFELSLDNKDSSKSVALDTTITPELKSEGNYRELVRAVQDLRKENGLTPQDMIMLTISLQARPVVEPFLDDFKKTILASTVDFADNDGSEIKIDKMSLRVTIKK
ncbi:MAG TPA: class I tRNA ligase family protein [Candidatus Paceibacterota bacterium]|nr:class I tRNA ligase family protein [Candidatus Paceibacterota bacterium]